jgi:hypothetical protein
MKKQHGPAFRQQLKPVDPCPVCRGRAVVHGVFHEMACANCNASGWVDAATGAALPLEDLVLQLNMKLQQAQRRINELERPVPIAGPSQQYQQNNRRGAGGTNYTGD